MACMIRIFQGDKMRDMAFPDTGIFRIGGTDNDDFKLNPLLKKGFVTIRKTNGDFTYVAHSLENAPTKGIVEKEKIYIINVERMEAFALFDIELSHITVADISAQKEIVVGRKEDCEIQIVSVKVSRHHAKLTKCTVGWQIEDLGSTNGTYVNGVLVSKEYLQDEDVIDISFCQMKITGDSLSIRYTGKVVVSVASVFRAKPYDEISGYPYLFKRSPRLKKAVEEETIEIQMAPIIGSAPTINWFSVLITPLVSVGLMLAMVMIFNFSTVSLLFSGSMAILGAVSGILNYRSQKKKHTGNEASRLEQYNQYLSDIVSKIKKAQSYHRNVLNEIHPSTKVCIDMAKTVDRQLWGKRIQDQDFMSLRIGSGEIPSKVSLQIPKEFLSLEKDVLASYPAELKDEYQCVRNCPIAIDVLRNVTVGIIGERSTVVSATKNLIVQAATHHSYDELKIVVLCRENEFAEWEFTKWLPHCFDETKTKRFIADKECDTERLLRELEDAVEERYKGVVELRDSRDRITPQQPYYLFVFADYETAKNHSILKSISKNNPNAGIGALFLFDDIYCLPKECGMIVEVANGKGTAYPRERANEVVSFTVDSVNRDEYDAFARAMAPIRIEQGNKNNLPVSVSFLQGYGIRRPKMYDLSRAWANAKPHKTMAVPIGVRANGESFLFDIHEKKHGPHGLVAGMTGSGKSEMVQTWILSMAMNFAPEDVSFVLIDFKGTGLILPFRNLPHLAGTISDLDTSIGRNLIALENELTRRKALLDQHGVNNIAAYKKLYSEGKANEPLSYLFIVIDEFAEFKVQYPEFMTVVNRVFAIGRTLGVSMLLLTQKPTNVVDDKMNANTRFRWCLKVASSSDSKDMLGHPDAAKITNPGRAIVQIGEDEVYETIQSYYSGAPYNPYKAPALSNVDKIAVVDLQGNRVCYELEKTTGYRATKNEIDVIVEHLDDYVRTNHLNRAKNIWVQKLPEKIYLNQLLSIAFDGEKWAANETQLQVAVGLIDDPRSQSQYPLKINMSNDGHLAVYGAPGTGKTTFLQTTAMSLALSYSPAEMQMYIMDFGGGNMQILKDLPHLGDIALADDDERMSKLARWLETELKSRKDIFASCGAMSVQACEELTGKKLPYIVLLLDNFAPVLGMYPQMDEFFIRLSREGGTYGIYWIVTTNNPNGLTFKINQNIKNAVALRMSDKADYSVIVGKTDGMEPENVLGRGLYKGVQPLEFQTALPVEGDIESDRIKNIRSLILLMNSKWIGARPEAIPVMPSEIYLDELRGDGIAIGLSHEGVNRVSFDPSVNSFVTISVSNNNNALVEAVKVQYEDLQYEQMIFFDGTEGVCYAADGNVKTIRSPQEFDKEIEALMPIMQNRKAEKTEILEKKFPPIIIFINNVGRCFDSMSNDTANRLNLMVTLGKNLGTKLIICGRSSEVSKLYHGGASFVVNCVNEGVGIALGDCFRAHSTFNVSMTFAEREAVLAMDEGYFIKNNSAHKFRAINKNRR